MKKTLQLVMMLLEYAGRDDNEKGKNNIMHIIEHHTVIQPDRMY